MVIILSIFAQAAYLNCLTSPCSSCLNNLIPYASLLCVEKCPFPNGISQQPCIGRSATISFLRFSEFLNFSSNSIDNFTTIQGLPFNDPSKSSPIPTFGQGFYFTSTSGLNTKVSQVLSPDFKVFLIGLFKSEGEIFEVFYGAQSYFKVFTQNNSIIFNLFAFSSGERQTMTYSINWGSTTTWMIVSFILRHSTDQVIIEMSNRFGADNRMLSVSSLEYQPGSGDADFFLGSTSGLGFKGFLFQFVYNLGPSLYDPVFTFRSTCLCDYNEYCNSSKVCVTCPQPSNDWPWCLRKEGTFCHTVNCAACNSFDYSGCTSCNNSKTSPNCDCGPYCTDCNTTFQCTECQSGYVLIGNYCLNEPFGYNISKTPAVDYVFSSFEQFKFGVFQSGNNSETYYPWNHEADDPVILNNRGAFLGSGRYFKSRAGFVMNYQFALGAYFNGEYTNFIMFNELVMDTRGTLFVTLTGIEKKLDVQLRAYYSTLVTWNLVIARVKFENHISTVYAKVNHNIVEQYSVEGFLFIQSKNQVKITANNKNLFIYSLVLYNDYYELNENYRKNDFRLGCSPLAYYNNYLKQCENCDLGFCSTFGSTHYCKYVECDNCTDITENCEQGNNSYCINQTVYYGGNCCSPSCKGCFNSHNFSCFGCYEPLLLLGHTCVHSCPFGFENISGKCNLTVIQIVNIIFDDIFFNFPDKTGNVQVFSGNESTIYPKLFSSHPIPAYQRGFYFRSTSYTNTSSLKMSFNFTLYFLIRFEKPGDVLTTNDFLFYMHSDFTMIVKDRKLFHKVASKALKLNTWIVLYIQLSASIYSTYRVLFTVDTIDYLANFGHYIFTEDPTSFYFGGNSSSFTGFLFEFRAYNGIISPVTSFQQCKNSSDINCYMNCGLTQVLSGDKCVNCTNCTLGCRNADSCSFCLDPLCVLCSWANSTCLKCKENTKLTSKCECIDGFFFDGNTQECTRCLNNCFKCTSVQSCECFQNSHREDLSCVCDPGYSMMPDGTCSNCNDSCETCTAHQYYRCSSCKNFLLISVCVDHCPFTFDERNNACFRVRDDVLDLHFNGKFELERIKDVQVWTGLRGYQPVPAFLRGWHFDNRNYLQFKSSTMKSILGLKFSAFFWIKVTKSGSIFTISEGKSETLKFSLEGFSFLYEIHLAEAHSFYFPCPNDLQSWMLVSLFLDYSELSSVSVSINSFLFPWASTSEFPFNNTNQATFKIGSSSSESQSFQGFLFDFHLKSSIIDPGNFLSSGEACPYFPINESCISNCNFQSFEEKNNCVACKSSCLSGCRSSNHCNRCEDEFCEKCLSFSPGCISCKENFYFLGERCAENCKNSQFLNLNTLRCENCKNTCLECENFFKCTKCVENSVLDEFEICQCLQGFELRLAETFQCEAQFFTVVLTVDSNNEVTLIFNESLESNLTETMIILQINQKVQNFSVTTLNSSWYLVIISSQAPTETFDVLTIDFPSVIYSKNNKMLNNTQLKALLYGKSDDSSSKNYLKNVKITTSNSVIIITSVVFSFSFFGMDIKSFINFKNSAELFYSVVLLDVEFDGVAETVLSEIRYSSTLPSIFEFLIDSNHGVALKSKFKKYGFKSSLFLLNSGMHLMFLSVLILAYLLFKVVEKAKPNKFSQKIIKKLEWDAFVKVLLNAYLELSLTAVISIASGNFKNQVQIADAIFSLIFLVRFKQAGNSAAIFVVFLINKKYFSLTSTLEKKEFSEKFESLLSVLRNNTTSFYFPIFLIRRLSFIFVYLLKDLPTYQLSFLLIFSFTNLFYLAFYNDLADKLFKVHLVLTEFCLIAFYAMILFKFVLKAEVSSFVILSFIPLSLGSQVLVIFFNLALKIWIRIKMRKVAPLTTHGTTIDAPITIGKDAKVSSFQDCNFDQIEENHPSEMPKENIHEDGDQEKNQDLGQKILRQEIENDFEEEKQLRSIISENFEKDDENLKDKRGDLEIISLD